VTTLDGAAQRRHAQRLRQRIQELEWQQAALQVACPDCDDLSRFAAGFTPHLSVGQTGSAEEARHLGDAFQRTWEPIRFEPSAVALLRRERETPFEVVRWIPLGVGGT
jgi:hypothetical protein